jgi:hypothetical protein
MPKAKARKMVDPAIIDSQVGIALHAAAARRLASMQARQCLRLSARLKMPGNKVNATGIGRNWPTSPSKVNSAEHAATPARKQVARLTEKSVFSPALTALLQRLQSRARISPQPTHAKPYATEVETDTNQCTNSIKPWTKKERVNNFS